jgi:phosphate/sulfate permease
MGIGIYKGVRNINFRLLGEIALGWLATPVMSGVIAFFSLFFMKNIFNMNVGHKAMGNESPTDMLVTSGADMSGIVKYLLLAILVAGTLLILYYYLLERKKRQEIKRSDEIFWKNLK